MPLPIANCALWLDDKAVRVAVGLWLGLGLCIPHICQCGAEVDAQGGHAMVCKRAAGKTARHHAMNDIIRRALTSADIPASKEPLGLNRRDSK